jgi:hypothetical protein
MESIESYYERPHRYPFSWNVKLPYCSRSNEARTLNPFHPDGGQFAPALDDAWQTEMESDYFDSRIIEDMRSGLDFYSVWPGVDENEFKFSFAGRQGGHLILESAYGINFAGFDLESLLDVQTEWGLDESAYSFAEVRRLYRAIVQMDSDFSSEHVRDSMLHAIAFQRAQWEEEQAERLESLLEEASAAKEVAADILAAMRSSELPAVIVRESRLRVARLARDARTARIEAARILFPDDANELFGKAS